MASVSPSTHQESALASASWYLYFQFEFPLKKEIVAHSCRSSNTRLDQPARRTTNIRTTQIYQGSQNDGQGLEGQVRSSWLKEVPKRVSRKWGTRIRSERRMVLHQNPKKPVTTKTSPSLGMPSKVPRQWCEATLTRNEKQNWKTTRWQRRLTDHHVLWLPFHSMESSQESSCEAGTCSLSFFLRGLIQWRRDLGCPELETEEPKTKAMGTPLIHPEQSRQLIRKSNFQLPVGER